MQRIVLFLLLCFWAWSPPPGYGADGASASISDLRLVAYGILQKPATGADAGRYVLVDKNGQTTYWISPTPKLSLDSHVGKQVEVVGKYETGQTAEKHLVAEAITPTKTTPPAHFVNVQSAPTETRVPVPPPPQVAPRTTTSTARSAPQMLPDSMDNEGPLLVAPNESTMDPYAPATASPWHVAPCGPPERIWARAEYLLWMTKGMFVPPLVTTSPLGTPQTQAGVLGADGTQILFGDEDLFTDATSGVRLKVGGWLGQRRWLGLEGDFTALENRGWLYQAGLNQYDIVARPFYNSDPAHPGSDSELVAYPNLIAGSVSVVAASQFRSAGLHLLGNIVCNSGCTGTSEYDTGSCNNGFRLDLLGGYRYIRLAEGLLITENRVAAVTPRVAFDAYDEFSTTNEFQGGEIGLVSTFRRSSWWAEGILKVAVGRTWESLAIAGQNTLILPPQSPVIVGNSQVTQGPGGLLAQPTNIGTYSLKETAWAPEIGLTLGYKLSPKMSATVGYTALFLSSVLRPGESIDLSVNGTYIPDPADPTLTPSGRPRPVAVISPTGYWAQGLNFGLDYRW